MGAARPHDGDTAAPQRNPEAIRTPAWPPPLVYKRPRARGLAARRRDNGVVDAPVRNFLSRRSFAEVSYRIEVCVVSWLSGECVGVRVKWVVLVSMLTLACSGPQAVAAP